VEQAIWAGDKWVLRKDERSIFEVLCEAVYVGPVKMEHPLIVVPAGSTIVDYSVGVGRYGEELSNGGR
jgi:hypothetical protein